jgi:threonine/homoserine/homoserine lactone efflux protein
LEIPFFIKGFLVGFFVACPLGPIGIICLQRTFSRGYPAGLFFGLGISTADAIYAFIAALGVTAISSFVMSQQLWLRLIGGIVVFGLGIRIAGQAGKQIISPTPQNGMFWGAYFSALILALMNPAVIISFTAIFAGLGIMIVDSNYFPLFLLIAGVFSGSALWYVLLNSIASLLKRKFTDTFILKINRLSGSLIAGFGLILVGGALLGMGLKIV